MTNISQPPKQPVDPQKRISTPFSKLLKKWDDLIKSLREASACYDYMLQNEAYHHLPALLEKDYGLVIEDSLCRGFMKDRKGRDVEVNIFGRARRGDQSILIIGECKAQLSQRDVDTFLRVRLNQLDTSGLPPWLVLVTHMVTQPGVAKYAQEKGVPIYFSYQFRP